MKIKVKYASPEVTRLEMPREGDIGIDLYSSETVTFLREGQVRLVSTGISVELPKGYWLQILDRSSMSKHFHVMAGVVDEGYRGEIKVRMYLHNPDDVSFHTMNPELQRPGTHIRKGDKIAQLIIRKNCNRGFEVEEVDDLSDTERGAGGFGSTGK